MKKLIFLFLPVLSFSQVGIQTTTPKATLHVIGKTIVEQSQQTIEAKATMHINGDLIISNTPLMSSPQYMLVIDPADNDRVKKVLISSILNNSGTCATFLKNQSNSYYLLFESLQSIPNPNNSIVIQGKTFVSAGTYTLNNKYYFSYTNTSGLPLDINQPFQITWTTLTCQYWKKVTITFDTINTSIEHHYTQFLEMIIKEKDKTITNFNITITKENGDKTQKQDNTSKN